MTSLNRILFPLFLLIKIPTTAVHSQGNSNSPYRKPTQLMLHSKEFTIQKQILFLYIHDVERGDLKCTFQSRYHIIQKPKSDIESLTLTLSHSPLLSIDNVNHSFTGHLKSIKNSTQSRTYITPIKNDSTIGNANNKAVITITGHFPIPSIHSRRSHFSFNSLSTRHPLIQKNKETNSRINIGEWNFSFNIERSEQSYPVDIYIKKAKTWMGNLNSVGFTKSEMSTPALLNSNIPQRGNTYKKTVHRDSLPKSIDIPIYAPLIVYPGGLKFGLGGKVRSNNKFTTRFGWEVGLYGKYFRFVSHDAGAYLSLDFDTNYRDYHVIGASFYGLFPQLVIFPSFGGGLGFVYNINDRDVGLRLLHETNYFIVGFSGSYDYYPKSKQWKVTLLGQVTL